MKTLITCKEGWEKILARETALYGSSLLGQGRGWILTEWTHTPPEELCFAQYLFKKPQLVPAASVNSLTAKLLDLFTAHIKGKRIEGPWPLLFFSGADKSLIQRAKTAEGNWLKQLHKRFSRIAKLAQKDFPPQSLDHDGFFVYFTQLEEAAVSFQAQGVRPQRMRFDSLAPSRSYLKLEEAFHLWGRAPKKGEFVVDLGAAPGGWSYSALKRGAVVHAVDNGPLKNGISAHANITHLKIDAFQYLYNRPRPADWLFCDLLEKPEVVLALLERWLSRRWCRFFVVNLKCGRSDPVALLYKVLDDENGLAAYCRQLRVKQLYHDREEITLMGETKG